MTDLHPLLVAERTALADTLDTLTPEQWSTPSLCSGWTCRDVAAHLIWPHEHSKGQMFLGFARSGFNLDRFSQTAVSGDRRSGAEIATAWRQVFESRWTPPGYTLIAPLTDTITHGADIRRPLGLPAPDHAPEALRAVLDFLVTKKAQQGFTAKGRLDGLELHATDLDWRHGSGATVAGPAELVMLAATGRASVLDELAGDGVATLRTRI